MIPDLGEALDQTVVLVDAALGDQWSAVADERDLNAPGALVCPGDPAFSLDRLDDTAVTATWDVWLVSRDLGRTRSLSALTEMLRAVASVLPVRDVQVQPVQLPNHGADPLPALTFTLTTEIT